MKTDQFDLRLQDNMELMKEFEDNHFDLAIVDPPYYSGPEKKQYYGKRIAKSKHSKTGSIENVKRVEYKPSDWADQIPTWDYLNELKRVSRHQIIWGINYFEFANYHPGRLIWNKINQSTSYSDCEIALSTFHESVRMVEYMWNGMMQGESLINGRKQQGNKKLNEKRIHPTQKPVKIYEWIINRYVESGQKILDTHMGSRSNAIAIHKANQMDNMNLHLTAAEINTHYYEKAIRRIKENTIQQAIF